MVWKQVLLYLGGPCPTHSEPIKVGGRGTSQPKETKLGAGGRGMPGPFGELSETRPEPS